MPENHYDSETVEAKLIVSYVTTHLIQQLGRSIVIIGEPQQTNTSVFPDQLRQELPVSYASRFKISNG